MAICRSAEMGAAVGGGRRRGEIERRGCARESADAQSGGDQRDGAEERGRGPDDGDGQRPAGVEMEPRVRSSGRRQLCGAAGNEAKEWEGCDQSEDGEPDSEARGGGDARGEAQRECGDESEQRTLPDGGDESAGADARETSEVRKEPGERRREEMHHCAVSSSLLGFCEVERRSEASAMACLRRASSSGSISSSPRTESSRRSRESPKKRRIMWRTSERLASCSATQGL